MPRTSLALLAPLALSLLSGCRFLEGTGDDAGDPPGPSVGTQESDLNERGCVPEGVTDNHALCLCGDFDNVGYVDVGGPGASVGINGRTEFVNAATIDGSWIAYGGFDAVTSTRVRGDLVSAHEVTWVGDLEVEGDLVAASVDGVGDLYVDGTVRSGGVDVVGWAEVGSYGDFPGNVAPPCGCDGRSLFSVAQAVQDAEGANDNALAGLSPEGIALVGAARVALPSGRYYLERLDVVGDLAFDIEGDVALFIGADVELVGDGRFTIAEGASLDLYVGGSVHSVGNVEYGSAADPNAFRLLVAGRDSVLVNVGSQTFYGHIFAPFAGIDFVGETTIVGSLFGRELEGVGDLLVEYGGPIATAESTCLPDPDAPSDDADGDAGGAGGAGADGGAGGAGEGGGGGHDPADCAQ